MRNLKEVIADMDKLATNEKLLELAWQLDTNVTYSEKTEENIKLVVKAMLENDYKHKKIELASELSEITERHSFEEIFELMKSENEFILQNGQKNEDEDEDEDFLEAKKTKKKRY